MSRNACYCALVVIVLGNVAVRCGEAATDTTSRLEAMQQRMEAMAKEIESQRQTINDQQKTLKQIQGVQSNQTAIAPNPGVAALTASDKTLAQKNADATPDSGHRRSWELPPITVTGEAEKGLHSEEKIGSYGQPRWTARRRFSETREYVIPKGEVEFEYWSIVEVPRHGGSTEVETKYEVEIGLPHRLQLDLYGITHQTGSNGPLKFDEQDFEMRWAFADWGKLPGNPTLYAEYKAIDSAPDHYEFKLLFGGESPVKGLHWAANTVFEHEMGGPQTNSYEFTSAVSYTVKDQLFEVGLESKLAFEDDRFHRGWHQPELLIGPSFQVSPLKQMHINIAPLIGCTEKSPAFKSLVIIGWEF